MPHVLTSPPSGLEQIVIPYSWWRRHPVHGTRIVYYLERSDGLIKIGTTGNYPQRRCALQRQHGPLSLAAWEPGSFELEKIRHAWFLWERPNRSEWFEPSRAVIGHIVALRAGLA